MQEIKKMGVLSVAKIEAVLCAVVGFIVGIIIALVGTAMMGMMQTPRAFGLYFGVASIIILPIVYGILGFIVGAVIAFLYNIVARAIGGIEIELVQK